MKRLIALLVALSMILTLSIAIAGDNDDEDFLYFEDGFDYDGENYVSYNDFMAMVKEYLGYMPNTQILVDGDYSTLCFDFSDETVRIPLTEYDEIGNFTFDRDEAMYFILRELSWYRSNFIGKTFVLSRNEDEKEYSGYGFYVIFDDYGEAYLSFDQNFSVIYKINNYSFMDNSNYYYMFLSGDEVSQYFYDWQLNNE